MPHHLAARQLAAQRVRQLQLLLVPGRPEQQRGQQQTQLLL
jgi:hypothetical protein